MNDFWSVVLQKKNFKYWSWIAQNYTNSMKNKVGTPILTILIGIHPRNIYTKFEVNPCSRLRKAEKVKQCMMMTSYKGWSLNRGTVSKWPCCRWDIKHNQPTNQLESNWLTHKKLQEIFCCCILESLKKLSFLLIKANHVNKKFQKWNI